MLETSHFMAVFVYYFASGIMCVYSVNSSWTPFFAAVTHKCNSIRMCLFRRLQNALKQYKHIGCHQHKKTPISDASLSIRNRCFLFSASSNHNNTAGFHQQLGLPDWRLCAWSILGPGKIIIIQEDFLSEGLLVICIPVNHRSFQPIQSETPPKTHNNIGKLCRGLEMYIAYCFHVAQKPMAILLVGAPKNHNSYR